MSVVDIRNINGALASDPQKAMTRTPVGMAALCACAGLLTGASPASAATLSRSVDVKASPAAVWAAIGPFCAIAQWHPAIGSCADDRGAPPVRTLVTKDGKATFVEVQTARNDPKRFYSYTFRSAPVPVTHYVSTISVAAKGQGASTVTWKSAYTPDAGKEKDASDALTGIYESGLEAIRVRFAK